MCYVGLGTGEQSGREIEALYAPVPTKPDLQDPRSPKYRTWQVVQRIRGKTSEEFFIGTKSPPE